MADSNVVEKPLLEKIQDLLERKPGNYDVAFCVGKEKKIVGAVKIILRASSPFLEKEFEEKWEVAVAKEGDGIPLPEFDPIAFELFVKLTSLDTWSLEILKALNLPPNQIFNLLSICRRFEMKEAEKNLKIVATIFLQSFGEYTRTDDFLQLSQTNLKSVLASDDIGIKELDVFSAAVRWADFQCRQIEVLPTEEQIREVLGDCLFEISFPIMTCAQFTKARDLKDILTAEETIGIYGFIGSTTNRNTKTLKFNSKILPFKTTPRNKVQTMVSKRNEILISQGSSRLCSTQGFESTKNSPIAINDALHAFNVIKENGAACSVVTLMDDNQLRPQPLDLESASLVQLPAEATLAKRIRWGMKINGFPSRSEHAEVAVGNAIYSFGGDGPSSDPSNLGDVLDVFVLNVNGRENDWRKLLVENSEVNPNQRSGHSAVAHKEFVFIFGGFDTLKRKYSNSAYRFNTHTLTWDKPKVTGNIPTARYFHSAVLFRNKMLIYVGMGEKDEVTSDLYSLDLESFRWSRIETKGIPPSPCWGHSATVHNGKFILIFGGWDKKKRKPLNTLHSFDVNNKTWTAVETRGTPPWSRRHHCAFAHDGRMYIFGGRDGGSLNDIFSYDPETLKWKEVTPDGEAPYPRFSAGCVALNDQVFIFGGAVGIWKYCDDTHVLQM